MEIIERIKKVNCTAELVKLENGIYRFTVYSNNGKRSKFNVRYTESVQIAYRWLVCRLVEWSDAISLYRH